MLRAELNDCGIKNVDIIPNFRLFKAVKPEELKADVSKPYRFSTFSRVVKEKGIEDAVDAIVKINEEAESMICRLDIYGPVDPDYNERFKAVIKDSTKAIVYKGVVEFDKAIDTLKDYYGVLFTTHWKGEGNAGTITESFIAGVLCFRQIGTVTGK